MLYPLLRPALFALDPETAHRLSLAALKVAVLPDLGPDPALRSEVAGIAFPGPLGAAPGYDKDGDWSWHENPYVGTRQLNGLLVANLILNNWDIKPTQNRIYEMDDRRQRPRLQAARAFS